MKAKENFKPIKIHEVQFENGQMIIQITIQLLKYIYTLIFSAPYNYPPGNRSPILRLATSLVVIFVEIEPQQL